MPHLLLSLVLTTLVLPSIASPFSFSSFSQEGQSLPSSSVVTCPCTFHVSVSRNAPPLDFLTIPITEWRLRNTRLTHSINFHKPTSLLAQSDSHAVVSNHRTNHFVIDVPTSARLVLLVRSASNQHRLLQPVHRVRITSTIRQNSKCPVLLQPHRPPTSRILNSRSISNLNTNLSLFKSAHKNAKPRIVGGDAANPNLANYLAFIVGTKAICTGTIVGPNLIITAAHCNMNAFATVYVSGSIGPSGTRHTIKSVHNHRRHNAKTDDRKFDISYIYLNKQVQPPSKAMSVNINASLPTTGSVVRMAGYGVLKSSPFPDAPEANSARRLYQVDAPIVDGDLCQGAYNGVLRLDSRYQVCAGYFGRGGCDSCQGDSGGPMFQYDTNNRPVLVGVVSIGVGCAERRYPGIYVRTSMFTDFLPLSNMTSSKGAVQVASNYEPPPSSAFDPPEDSGFGLPLGSSLGRYAGIGIAMFVVISVLLVIYMFKNCRGRDVNSEATPTDTTALATSARWQGHAPPPPPTTAWALPGAVTWQQQQPPPPAPPGGWQAQAPAQWQRQWQSQWQAPGWGMGTHGQVIETSSMGNGTHAGFHYRVAQQTDGAPAGYPGAPATGRAARDAESGWEPGNVELVAAATGGTGVTGQLPSQTTGAG